jgi:SAM-dependent methyltransferase
LRKAKILIPQIRLTIVMTTGSKRATTKTAQTLSMKGAGYYSQRTRGAKNVIDNAANMLFDAVHALPHPLRGHPIRIADFGAADGGTSKKAIRDTVSEIRSRFPDCQIQVTYTDLPSNDFSVLFRNILGVTEDPEHTYIDEFDDVFVHACGVGFHEQLFPNKSLDLGFSATAMHYLSEKPCEIDHHVHMVGAAGSVLEAFTHQAAEDWQNILLARARELRPGGRLVFMNFGKDEDGRHLGNTGGISMFDTFNDLWAQMATEGLITKKEYTNATFPQFYRTKEEFCEPLTDILSPVYAAGLRLVSAHTGLVRCPYRKAYEDSSGSMSSRKFAISYVPTLRSWSETVFLNALSLNRPAEQKRDLIDYYYKQYENLVASNPTGHAMDYVHCYLAIEKIASEC